MNCAGKRVLITGATGFLGNRLVEALGDMPGVEIRALVHQFMNASRIARYPLEMIGGSITDGAAVAKAMEGCDVVFHLAFGSHGSDAERRQATVDGVRAVCAAALRHRVTRLVYTSSISVYGETADGDLNENSPRRRSGDVYGDSKLEAEGLILRYCQEQGLPAVILQPTIVYGPYAFWSRWPIMQLQAGKVILPDDGRGVCNAVYVDDVVSALLLAAKAERVDGQVFVISGAEHPTWKDYYEGYARFVAGSEFGFQSGEALAAILKRQARSEGSMLKMAKRAAKSARLRETLLAIPGAGYAHRCLKRIVPRSNWSRLKGALGGGARPERAQTRAESLPLPAHLSLFRSRTLVRIDKATGKLGYRPEHSLAEGLRKTEAWARWFRLVG